MSVELSPSTQLGFNRPFNQIVKRTLNVTNHNAQPVAFKVKTTAPKLYCVRPNSGRIEAGETCEVPVLLQPMKEDPPLNTKCKDKFLVQTTFITPEREQGSISELWAVAEKSAGENGIHQQKIRVAYLPPEGDGIPEEPEQPSHINGMDSALYDSVRETPYTNGNGHPTIIEPEQSYPTPVISAPAPEEPADETFNQAREEVTQASIVPPAPEPEPEPAPVPAPAPPVLAAPPPVPEPAKPVEVRAASTSRPHEPVPVTAPIVSPNTSAKSPDNDLLAKYADAQAEIERLRAMLASYSDPALPNVGLRRRGHRSNEEEDTRPSEDTKFVESQPEGVPPLVVIMIALGVFITTYLFF